MSLAILVPVLGRPRNVRPLLESVRESTPAPYRVLFLCDPDDYAEHAAIDAAGGWRESPGGSYAQKIRAGVALTDEPYVLLAADDIRPRRGWLGAALAAMVAGVEVVGLNDLRPRDYETATHFLLTRAYAQEPTIDGGPGPMHSYIHNFCDRELIETAKHRGVYAYAPDAVVEHRHHLEGHAPLDATYEKGQATFRRDAREFRHRSVMWASL